MSMEEEMCVVPVEPDDTVRCLQEKVRGVFGRSVLGMGLRLAGSPTSMEVGTKLSETAVEAGSVLEVVPCTVRAGRVQHTHEIKSLTVSPCGAFVAASCSDSLFAVFSTETHERLFAGEADAYGNPSFSPCSAFLAVGTPDHNAAVYTIATHQSSTLFTNCSRRVATAWTPCGRFLLCVSSNTASVWETQRFALLREWDIVFTGYSLPVGEDVMVVQNDTVAEVWEHASGRRAFALTEMKDVGIFHLALSEEGRYVVACGGGAVVRIWDIGDGGGVLLHSLHDAHGPYLYDTAISTAGDLVAVSNSREVTLWTLSTGAVHRTAPLSGRSCDYGLALSRCGKWVFLGDGEGVLIEQV